VARHLSVNIRVAYTAFPEWLCTALIKSNYFQLATIGGIDGHETGDHWFLSGYALEDFVDRFLARAHSPPVSTEVASGFNGNNDSYLREIATRVSQQRAGELLSPFETASVNLGLTFLNDHRLGSEEITHCRTWFAAHSNAILYFYGAIDLSGVSPKPAGSPGTSAFRELNLKGEPGEPFLLVRAGRAPLANDSFDVTLRAQSTLWLEDHLRHVLPLTAFAGDVVQATADRRTTVSLEMEGRPFLRQEEQLRLLFANILDG